MSCRGPQERRKEGLSARCLQTCSCTMRSTRGCREPIRTPFARYADDAICHCKSVEEARALWSALQDRFAACKLVLHPEKTKIVHCKDVNRRGDFPNIHFDFLGFQFRARKIARG